MAHSKSKSRSLVNGLVRAAFTVALVFVVCAMIALFPGAIFWAAKVIVLSAKHLCMHVWGLLAVGLVIAYLTRK